MSGSVTVIGSHTGSTLTGIVTVPVDFPVGNLQSTLTTLSQAVLGGAEGLNNSSVAGGAATIPSIFELTGSSVSLNATVPGNYNALIVEAPGSDTIAGNGSSGFLGVFGANSSVTFNTNGGSGSVFASGNDTLNLAGVSWSVIGGSEGGVAINTSSAATYATLTGAGSGSGPSNAIGSYSDNLNVLSEGSNDFFITAAGLAGATDTVTVTGFANLTDIGASDTVFATGSGSFVGSFGAQGGKIDFVNLSTAASSIIGNIDPTTGLLVSPGSVTVSAGAGGGVFDGGTNGSNSLVGGSGLVTLFAAGEGNFLSASGKGSSYNLLNAASGSNDTLVGSSVSGNNVFFAGSGTESIVSSGTGVQDFFAGTLGSETISGSSVAGATNTFIFNQSSAQGGGTYTILNFKSNEGYINLGGGKGVSISGAESLPSDSKSTEIDLTNGSTIKLIGVNVSTFENTKGVVTILGSTHF